MRRIRAIGLMAPLLLVVGFGVGSVTTEGLEAPESTPRLAAEAPAPRVHLEVLSRHMERLQDDGSQTEDWVALYQDHVAPVEAVLRRRGVNEATARQVAWPLVQHSYRRGLDPAFVLSVVLIRVSPWASALAAASSRIPSRRQRWRTAARSSGLFSPMPAVNTSASSPPSAPASEPSSRRMR